MNYRLVVSLSAFGLAMGAASLFGLIPRGNEGWLWLAIGVLCAAWIAWRAPAKPFVHGFLAGLLAGMLSPLLQVVFFPVYLAHNPYAAETFKQLPPSLSPRLLVLLMTPVLGLLGGLVLGLLAWLAGKAIRRPAGMPAP